jgi:addiction module RelE/StbE family toxin
MRIEYTTPFKKSFKKIIAKKPDVVFAVIEKLLLLSKEPGHPSLKLHKLKGRLNEFYAISIEYNLRITLEIESDLVRLLDIGTHDEVY